MAELIFNISDSYSRELASGPVPAALGTRLAIHLSSLKWFGTFQSERLMHLRISSAFFTVASTALATTGPVFAQSLSPHSTGSIAPFNESLSRGTDNSFEQAQTSSPVIRKLVKKMLTKRTTMDICDKGTGRCK